MRNTRPVLLHSFIGRGCTSAV
uniref:Uncharacterized protein n=1 Tax=Arundo donax TaxID=35708 RepID=A0A0A9HED8_ARUDO